MGFAGIDILIFIAVAVFLFFRLRDTLGTKTGSERKRHTLFDKNEEKKETALDDGKVIDIKPKFENDAVKNADKDTVSALTRIALGDPDFRPEEFLEGAKNAFEYIVENFASGDKEALEPLLSHELMDAFEAIIDERAKKDHVATTDILNVKKAEILRAFLNNDKAYITVRFVADETKYLEDEDGTLIEGDPEQIHEIKDIWTFERPIRNVDPNWILVETNVD
ncbi:MAG: translocase [Rickettsiales bacterium]|nr:translocase [Rickettsiales bacterium]|tara:strand:+ start:448 stop:1116 length:669 start_codon:yes stop_codon:yes gene_type:complete